MEGKGDMMAMIEAGGRMLKEEDSIVKAEGRQPRWLSRKLVLWLVVALVWLNFQKWGKWYPITIAPGLWCLKSMPLRERAEYRSEHIQNRGDKGWAWVIRPPEVHQLWASTSYGRTSQTSAGQRQKAKHQQRWKEQWTETQRYVSPWINNDATAPGRWLPVAQVWGLEFNPQHPGKIQELQLALVIPMWGKDKRMAGLSGQPATRKSVCPRSQWEILSQKSTMLGALSPALESL